MPIIVAIAYILFVVFVQGFVASVLWGWFPVPLGVPAIEPWHAIGICFLLRMLLPDSTQNDNLKPWKKKRQQSEVEADKDYDWVSLVVDSLGEPVFILVICWFLK